MSMRLKDGRKCWVIYDLRLKDSRLLHNLDRTLAIIGVILSAFLILYLGREIGRVVYLLTGVLALISCLMWLAIGKSHTFKFNLPDYRILTALWSICFFGLFALSILSVHFRPELYQRPIFYFALTALMAGAIACEILSTGRNGMLVWFSSRLCCWG